MKLYYVPKTRATRPRWMLEELGVPYELVRLEPGKDTRSAEHLARQPLGHVPVLEDGEQRVFESAAICLYLADKYPERALAPPMGSPGRGLVYQWISFVLTELEPPLGVLSAEARRPEAERSAAVATEARERARKAVTVLEEVLRDRPFLLGSEFSVADVVVGAVLAWAKGLRLLEGLPAAEAYVERLLDRPAWRRARAD